MAQFDFYGLDELQQSFKNIEMLPNAVTDEMLNAQADILVKAQKRTASTMLQGKYYRGDIMRSIRKSKVKSNRDGKAIYVYPQGTNSDGNRNAEVAFINEFGAPVRRIKARPFIETANRQSENEVVEAAEKALDDFLKKNNL